MRIRAELRFKNEELISRRREAGFETQAKFAEAVGCAAITISNYETFKGVPQRDWIIQAIEEALDCDITDIFPLYLKEISKKLAIPRIRIVDIKQLQPYMTGGLLPPGPEESFDLKELRRDIKKALHLLSIKERIVLIRRFGLFGWDPESLAELGENFGLTPERIRQIEAKALRKLKHPSRSRGLKRGMSTAEKAALYKLKFDEEA